MSTNREFLKSIALALFSIAIAIYGSLNFLETYKSKIFSILIIILLTLTYLILLKNDLDQLENEYDHEMSEYEKKWKTEIAETQADLEKRGMTFSGESTKKLGTLSVYPNQPKGEIEKNRDNYIEYRTKKFELDLLRAKYLVLINLFNIKK